MINEASITKNITTFLLHTPVYQIKKKICQELKK